MGKELSQLENTQTVVLQQTDGKKIYLDLNVSTDTTAISSFALSVMIALILGGLATWLAYWFGRKSFKLTEMSFDTVIEQIKASEKAHIDSNNMLIKSQQEIFQKEAVIRIKHDELNQFRETLADFYYSASALSSLFSIALNNLRINKFHNVEAVRKANIKLDEMDALTHRIHLYLIIANNQDEVIYNQLNKLRLDGREVILALQSEVFDISEGCKNTFDLQLRDLQKLLNDKLHQKVMEMVKAT